MSSDFFGFTLTETITASAAVVAVFVSIWAAQTARQTGLEQHKIDKRMLLIEEAREADRVTTSVSALLSAAFVSHNGQTVLRIKNRGNGRANSPTITVNNHDTFETALNMDKVTPPAAIGSDAHFDFRWFTYDGMKRHYTIELNWKNDDGSDGMWNSSVSI